MTILARDSFGAAIAAIYPGTTQEIDTTASSGQSAAVGATTTIVRLVTKTAPCRVAFGANPTAAAADTLLPLGVPEYFAIRPGDKIAAIRDGASDGKLQITEGANFVQGVPT